MISNASGKIHNLGLIEDLENLLLQRGLCELANRPATTLQECTRSINVNLNQNGFGAVFFLKKIRWT